MKKEKIIIHFHDKVLAWLILRFLPKVVTPNHLTILRFILTPFVVWLMWEEYYLVGAIVFLFTAFTDALDGSLARTTNRVTRWGKMFDPVADKLLICSVVYILVVKYLDPYTALAIIIMEALIITGALMRARQHKHFQANIWGKIKMNLQVAGVMILLIGITTNVEQLWTVSRGTFYLAVGFGFMSAATHRI